MTSLKQKTDAQFSKTRSNNPKFADQMEQIIAEQKTFQHGDLALSIGSKAPNFELPNAVGKVVSLETILSAGPAVVTFYRGSWCPYCNLQLRALSARLPEIHALGTQLIAISPQVPDESLSIVEKHDLTFPVLSDQDANIATKFGVAWKVPEILLEHMQKDRGLDLERINNGNDSILPIPATFIIDQDQNIVWRFIDVDYRNRSEPEDILTALKALN